MIRQTQFAASTDESRPILNGINVISSNKTLELVAIDGFRLAVRQERLEDDVPDLQFIVPVKAMNEVARVFEPSEGPVKIYPSHNHILLIREYKGCLATDSRRIYEIREYSPEYCRVDRYR